MGKSFPQSYRLLQPVKTMKPLEHKLKMMTINTARKLYAVMFSAVLSASAFALTPSNGTWVKETATYGPPNLPDAYVLDAESAGLRTIKRQHYQQGI
jgi:hypothetical protein